MGIVEAQTTPAVGSLPNPLEKLFEILASDLEAVSAEIRVRMSSENAPRIPEVTAHLVDAGGKRLRPMLTLAAARMLDYEGNDHVRLGAAVEFIHTATLLHDDVVDKSSQRRGRATANLLWDNKSSVLVGDYLFARSFGLMVETGSLEVLKILSNASATIAEGEVLQLAVARSLTTDEPTYLKVVRGKTAALFAAACEVGAIIAGADKSVSNALADYGDALGIAFQIADDLLDYDGDTVATGKNVGDDFREQKLTLPLIKAIARADAAEMDFWRRTIETGRQADGDLETAQSILNSHGALDAARRDALAWSQRAKDSLNPLPDHPIKDALAELADFVLTRGS